MSLYFCWARDWQASAPALSRQPKARRNIAPRMPGERYSPPAPEQYDRRRADVRSAILLAVFCLLIVTGAAPIAGHEATTMKIRMTVDGKVIEATLLDNATARDFLSLLPLTLTLEDYASTEKISYLARKLSTAGAPAGVDPAPGDIAYYAPWGNVAIFYRDAAMQRVSSNSVSSIRASRR